MRQKYVQLMTQSIRMLVHAGAVVISFCGAGSVCAGELGHYAPALLNIRDFFVPEPGFYGALYNYFYSTDTPKNRNGDEVSSLTRTGALGTTTASVEPEVDVFVLAPAFMWVSPWQVLGARYGAVITPHLRGWQRPGLLERGTFRQVSRWRFQ